MPHDDDFQAFRKAGMKLRLVNEERLLANVDLTKIDHSRRHATADHPCDFCEATDQRLLTDVDGMWECDECRHKLHEEIYGPD